MKTIRVGLAGNPNSGKTTIFNALTGLHQKTGNYAGVTVEKKQGRLIHGEYELIIYDLPGTYSLTSYSLDEVVTRDFILLEKPDILVDVLDATNLERNLYLCLQFRELGLPLVGALNITDQAESRGIRIDEKQLSSLLGFPIIKTVGPKGRGLGHVIDEIIEVYEAKGKQKTDEPIYGPKVEQALVSVVEALTADPVFLADHPPRWFAAKLLEKDQDAARRLDAHAQSAAVRKAVGVAVAAIEKEYGRDAEIIMSEQRYAYIHGAAKETIIREERPRTVTEKIDAVLLHRLFGLPIFLGLLWLIFQATFFLGAWPQAWLEAGFGLLAEGLNAVLPEGLLRSLLVDGMVAGVGGVLSFLPLVVILFVFISILEDTGYMARAAFIMDRFLHLFGLHGQSFLPMMIGFGCSVPAVLAARTLKSPRDRIITVLVIPFMSCGAKLPVYVLLAGTFFSANAGSMVLLIYLIGVFLAMLSALLFRKTILRGENTPFVMELPPYRLPTGRGIGRHVLEKAGQYFRKAGTVILAASILIWAITTFPQKPEGTAVDGTPVPAGAAEQMEYSIAGRIGKFIEPAFAPLGFDWKIGIATVTGFAAKEVVVSTLGVLYRVEGEVDEESDSLREVLRNDPSFNPLVAFCLMLFTLILAPCIAAQATIRAELGWKWLGFYVLFSVIAAWGICFAVFRLGSMLGWGV